MTPGSTRIAIADGSLFLGNRGPAALRYLAEAADFARELGRDRWDFAVEIQTFRELGLTNNDFRWLVCKGLVECQREITAVGDTCRVFQPDCPLSFSENACFVLSEAGLAYMRSGPASPETSGRGGGKSCRQRVEMAIVTIFYCRNGTVSGRNFAWATWWSSSSRCRRQPGTDPGGVRRGGLAYPYRRSLAPASRTRLEAAFAQHDHFAQS